MTLVVAARLGRKIRLFCDSKITNDRIIHGGYLTDALKAIIIGRNLCVAYARNVIPALDAIRTLDSRRQLKADQVLATAEVEEILHRVSRDTYARSDPSAHTDFLVASLSPVSLAEIRGDSLQRKDTAWIGDPVGWAAYQRHLHEPTAMAMRATAQSDAEAEFYKEAAQQQLRSPPPEPSGVSEYDREDVKWRARLWQAFRDVIADPDVDSVDEFPIGVLGDIRGFRYSAHLTQFGGASTPAPAGVETPLQLAKSAAEGGFGYSILIPEPGIDAIGVHFLQARLGALLHPLAQDEPIRYPELDQRGFIAAVQADYGFGLKGWELTGATRVTPPPPFSRRSMQRICTCLVVDLGRHSHLHVGLQRSRRRRSPSSLALRGERRRCGVSAAAIAPHDGGRTGDRRVQHAYCADHFVGRLRRACKLIPLDDRLSPGRHRRF
jgi:hypothetical protein